MMTVVYGTQTLSFEVEHKENLKHTYITVEQNKPILVKAPLDISTEELKKLVKKKASWIIKKREALHSSVMIEDTLKTGSRLHYLGKSYYVQLIKEGERQNIHIEFIYSKFQIFLPMDYIESDLQEAINTFYLNSAKLKIKPFIKKWSKIMELKANEISFKNSKVKWASCSASNKIMFNIEMVKLSKHLIEYVVIHELAHIRYKNHSNEFWSLVARYLPKYKLLDGKIKEFERSI